MRPDVNEMPCVTSGTQKWNGVSPSFMAIAAVFDALVTPRVYREPVSTEEAFSIIEEESGTRFDPVLVRLFLDSEKEVMDIFKQYQDWFSGSL